MTLLHDRLPGLDARATSRSAPRPTPVRRLDGDLVGGAEVWLKDESVVRRRRLGRQQGPQAGVDPPEAQRRGVRTLFTVGGIGTHWGLALRSYGREHGLRTMLGLVDQPVDDHVREQLARLERQRRRAAPLPRPAAAQARCAVAGRADAAA